MHSNGVAVDVEALFDLPLFSSLDEPGIKDVARGGWAVSFCRGDRVISRGDELDGLYLVLEGKLKLYMLSCNGDERVLRILQAEDTFGEAIMFNAFPSPVFVDALASTRLAYFPREVITDALVSYPNFMSMMLQSMSALMRDLIRDLETCCMQNAAQRTVSYLLRQAETSPPPHIALTLPAPKAVVASTLNMSAETFSRELHRLQDLGHIEIKKRVIRLLNKRALLNISLGQAA